MLNRLNGISERKCYWLTFILLCVMLEASALFYQYVLNYGPCILCIHVRIIVMGILLISLAGFYLRQYRPALIAVNSLMVLLFGALLDRSYKLLGVERGFITGSCGFDSGLPSWFQIDKWFPFMFEIWESCGYTPVLLFGVTMAETLLVMSIMLCIFTGAVLVKQIRQS